MDAKTHEAVIADYLKYVNERTDHYCLKGGTALRQCYGLDRISEDIDLDAGARDTNRQAFFDLAETFSNKYGYAFRIGKDTETVGRIFLNYGDVGNPLKIEVSYRRLEIPADKFTTIKGIKVYTLSELTLMKAATYLKRDKIRDLYDVTFLCIQRFDDINQSARDALCSALEYKDLEQFDYITRTQSDPLIDVAILETAFLESFEKVGLLTPSRQEEAEPQPANHNFTSKAKTNFAYKDKQSEPPQSRSPKDAARGASASANARSGNTPSKRFKGR